MVVSLQTGNAIKDRDEIIHKLIEIQYDRNDMDFKRGTFRVRGDVVWKYFLLRIRIVQLELNFLMMKSTEFQRLML